MANDPKPVVLIIRDGWGCNPHPEHDPFNAVKIARTPNCDALGAKYPWTLIHTSGEHVGLPEGTMGNSEVGHQNIGAGRIVDQDSVRITKAIRIGDFFDNRVLCGGIAEAKASKRTVHLLGLASDAGVHGLLNHLYACLELCKRMGHVAVMLHLFTDGRDTGPFTGRQFVAQIQAKCRELGVGQIASIVGRYYAMDRDNRWERVEKAYRCLTGQGVRQGALDWATSADEAVGRYYEAATHVSQQGDEFVIPTMIGSSLDQALQRRIGHGDTVIFYNYRGDRPRQLVKAFVFDDQQWAQAPPSPDRGVRGFPRGGKLDVTFLTMTAYEQGLPVQVAFPRMPKMSDIAGEYLSRLGRTQFRCAETEKFPHVTFFFNDYREEPFAGESRKMPQSPKVPTYDRQPEMSAPQVCRHVLDRIAANDCEDLILVNFANGDMVGHTGNLEATVKAVHAVDQCVGKIAETTLARGGALMVTADHGNAEQMYDPDTGSPHTAHTTYDVQCIVVDERYCGTKLREGGRLADILPTTLELMGLDQPQAMEGRSLLPS